jgi:hypothetical protein
VTAARGIVINVHRLGATVRLDDGSLAAVPLGELLAHELLFNASLSKREPIALDVETRGMRHRVAFVARAERERPAPSLAGVASVHDSVFEEQMRRYLKATEEWAPADRPAPAERHFIRKKRRAAHFESRTRNT